MDVLVFGSGSPRPFSTITRPKDKVYLERDCDDNVPGHGGERALYTGRNPLMVLFVDGHVAGPFLYDDEFGGLPR